MVAHNADFDMSFIKKNCQRQGYSMILRLWIRWPGAIPASELNRFKLDTVAKAWAYPGKPSRAVDDADVRQRFL